MHPILKTVADYILRLEQQIDELHSNIDMGIWFEDASIEAEDGTMRNVTLRHTITTEVIETEPVPGSGKALKPRDFSDEAMAMGGEAAARYYADETHRSIAGKRGKPRIETPAGTDAVYLQYPCGCFEVGHGHGVVGGPRGINTDYCREGH